jgi:hypothetical protein
MISNIGNQPHTMLLERGNKVHCTHYTNMPTGRDDEKKTGFGHTSRALKTTTQTGQRGSLNRGRVGGKEGNAIRIVRVKEIGRRLGKLSTSYESKKQQPLRVTKSRTRKGKGTGES